MRLSRVQFFWLAFMGRFESEKKIGIEYISNFFIVIVTNQKTYHLLKICMVVVGMF